MATIKAYSVAKTEKGYGSAVAASGVYSFSATHAGRNGVYDYPTEQGASEGRTPTLVTSGQTAAQLAAPLADNDAGPATGVALDAALGAGSLDWDAGPYLVTTTNQGTCTGAGLIVQITVAGNGAVTIDNPSTSIKAAGEGYATDDTDDVSLDIPVANTVSVTVA